MKVSLPQRNKLAQSMLWNLFLLTVGAVFFSLGAQAVAAHHGFLTGGIFGAGLLGWYTTGLFTPAIWYLLINIPLFFVSWFQIGRQFFFYSLYGSLATTIISELITFQVPIQDHFYAAITAGVLCGTGTGLMLRTLGSGGGLDLIGVILNKRWNIGIGRFNFSFNAVMFLASMATISLDMVIVSFIQVFVASATIEYALRMGSQRKMVYVVTDRGEALCEAIIAEGYGGATVLKGKGARMEFTGVTFAGKGQNLDTGAKVVHAAPDTSSYINTKSISKDGGISTFRSSVVVTKEAENSKAAVSCQSLMLDSLSRSDTIPAMDIRTKKVNVGHEAQIGSISDEAVFYLMSRGMSEEDARACIVSGFADNVSKELPLEYALEMNNLIRLEMKGSIG